MEAPRESHKIRCPVIVPEMLALELGAVKSVEAMTVGNLKVILWLTQLHPGPSPTFRMGTGGRRAHMLRLVLVLKGSWSIRGKETRVWAGVPKSFHVTSKCVFCTY
jgi:hypothetical protein